MGQWDVLLGRKHAKKEKRKQKKRSEAQEALLLREAGAAVRRAERTARVTSQVASPRKSPRSRSETPASVRFPQLSPRSPAFVPVLGLSATARVHSETGAPTARDWAAQSQPLAGRYGGATGDSELAPQGGVMTSPRTARKTYAQTLTEGGHVLPALPSARAPALAKRDWVGFLS